MSIPQNSRIFSLILLLLGSGVTTAQVYWEPLIRRETLAGPLPYERVDCFSSHGQGITNEDRGNYLGHDEDNWNILCDYQGPGVLTEFGWTRRNPAASLRYRIFVDDTVAYDLDVRADSLCGRTSPFLSPLADSTSGWSWNFAPVPFQQHLRITYIGNTMAYHGCVTLYDEATTIESFRIPVSLPYVLKRDTMATVWAQPSMPAMASRPATSLMVDSTVSAYADLELLLHNGAGVVRKFWFIPQDTSRSFLDRTVARIFVDHNPEPAISAPIGLMFGCSYGVATYASAITGRIADTLYFNALIPFSTQFRVEFQNNVANPPQNRIHFGADVVTLAGANVPRYRLGGKVFHGVPTRPYNGFRAVEFHGKGNYLGVVLEIENTAAAALEGDETLRADGEVVRQGIGMPEYFNASYNWLAPNGTPAYSRKYAHGVVTVTNNDYVAYRYHMSDAVPFNDSLSLDFEIGAWGHLAGNYRSLALAYLDPPPCSVRDQDSSHTSVGGEILSIFCRGLNNGRVLQSVTWNGLALDYVSGFAMVVDSVLNVKYRAPFAPAGVASLIVHFTDGSMTVDPAWEHRAAPQLDFRVLNNDANHYAYASDSVEITLRGYPEGESVNVLFLGHELAWAGEYPQANNDGVIFGKIILPEMPSEMPEGYGKLTAHARMTEGFPDATSDEYFGAYRLARIEVESLPVVQTIGGTISDFCATDHQNPDSLDPWGRMVVKKMSADTAGESATLAFLVNAEGSYRLSYFLGIAHRCGYVSIKVDNTLDVDSVLTFSALLPDDQWQRSDTIRGQWYYFGRGAHTITFSAQAATSFQDTFDMILDQILLESEFHQGIPVAAEPRPELPQVATLLPPYPNPFNANTRLKFRLNQSADVQLEIFNLLGQRVTSLVHQRLEAGEYVREFSCPDCASGLYLARLSLPSTSITQKLLLLK